MKSKLLLLGFDFDLKMICRSGCFCAALVTSGMVSCPESSVRSSLDFAHVQSFLDINTTIFAQNELCQHNYLDTIIKLAIRSK